MQWKLNHGWDNIFQGIAFENVVCTISVNLSQSECVTLEWRHNGRDSVSNHQLMIVYSTVYSDADQRKPQSSVSLAFVRGIHRGRVNSQHKWPVTRKMFPFDDVIMNCLFCCEWTKRHHHGLGVVFRSIGRCSKITGIWTIILGVKIYGSNVEVNFVWEIKFLSTAAQYFMSVLLKSTLTWVNVNHGQNWDCGNDIHCFILLNKILFVGLYPIL